jgi:hypothetical protein
MKIQKSVKQLIESEPVAIATVMREGKNETVTKCHGLKMIALKKIRLGVIICTDQCSSVGKLSHSQGESRGFDSHRSIQPLFQ